ncbi:MAG: hypothetical protein ABL888_16330 [Pirellulaceae bacterium]
MEPVLGEFCDDGFFRIYGSKNVNALTFNRPRAGTVDNEKKIEELIYGALPFAFKKIYCPGMVRCTGHFRPMDVENVLNHLANAYLFAALSKDKSVNHRDVILSALIGGGR